MGLRRTKKSTICYILVELLRDGPVQSVSMTHSSKYARCERLAIDTSALTIISHSKDEKEHRRALSDGYYSLMPSNRLVSSGVWHSAIRWVATACEEVIRQVSCANLALNKD